MLETERIALTLLTVVQIYNRNSKVPSCYMMVKRYDSKRLHDTGGFFSLFSLSLHLKYLRKEKYILPLPQPDLFLLLLLRSHFSRVQLCVIPQTAAHQAPPSLGFSRQEHWSGLRFSSPMHEGEK